MERINKLRKKVDDLKIQRAAKGQRLSDLLSIMEEKYHIHNPEQAVKRVESAMKDLEAMDTERDRLIVKLEGIISDYESKTA